VIADLKINSERGFAISAEVSKASQSMSEVSAEQAASSQEVLACIEEIISVTKSNSEKTARADGFVKNCNHVIHQATVVMNDLTGAMDEISEMSGKTSDIVKTIDDIAFQTNLLALNAAIEAARAGKTGSGFAVVADEVRSLAIRATESAKHTDALIEQIVQKIKSVRSFLYDANKAFTAVNTNALETGKIVTEISASSAEQSESLEQICVSVSEIDKAVQQNAAAAEELSAASAEMNCQSQKIDGCVKAMTSIVGKNQKYQRSQKQDGNNDDDTQNESS
jgi:methyl-accepting chemotaxis protein